MYLSSRRSFRSQAVSLSRRSHYHAWGLKSSYAKSREFQGYQFYSLPQTLYRLGHIGRRIDIFKIDCEGCEWTSYKDWLNEDVDIRQLQIEMHAASRNIRPNETMATIFEALLDRGFVSFSKEANTYPGAVPSGTYYEFAFVRLDPSFFREPGLEAGA
jgi:hypothetical protein